MTTIYEEMSRMELGRLVTRIQEEAFTYDEDAMSTNAPAESRALTHGHAVRAVAKLLETRGFRSGRAFADEIVRRSTDRVLEKTGLATILDDVDALVAEIREKLGPNGETTVLILSASTMLPTLDLSSELNRHRLLERNGTLSPLGRFVARAILAEDPEAR